MTIDIEISEVGPRDGLQSIDTIMPLDAKKAWIKAEAEARVPEIEVGSFVPAKVLPQLADTAAVVEYAVTIPNLTVAVLVPNARGAEGALKAGAHKLTLPLSVSETHSLKNLNRTHAQVMDEVRRVRALIDELPADRRPKFEGSLSTCFRLHDRRAHRTGCGGAPGGRTHGGWCRRSGYFRHHGLWQPGSGQSNDQSHLGGSRRETSHRDSPAQYPRPGFG